MYHLILSIAIEINVMKKNFKCFGFFVVVVVFSFNVGCESYLPACVCCHVASWRVNYSIVLLLGRNVCVSGWVKYMCVWHSYRRQVYSTWAAYPAVKIISILGEIERKKRKQITEYPSSFEYRVFRWTWLARSLACWFVCWLTYTSFNNRRHIAR